MLPCNDLDTNSDIGPRLVSTPKRLLFRYAKRTSFTQLKMPWSQQICYRWDYRVENSLGTLVSAA